MPDDLTLSRRPAALTCPSCGSEIVPKLAELSVVPQAGAWWRGSKSLRFRLSPWKKPATSPGHLRPGVTPRICCRLKAGNTR